MVERKLTFTDDFKLTQRAGATDTDVLVYDEGGSTCEFFLPTHMRVSEASSDTSGWVTISPSTNDDACISFEGSAQTFSAGIDEATGQFRITNSDGMGTATRMLYTATTPGWQIEGDSIIFAEAINDTTAIVKITPNDSGNSYISFVGDTDTFSIGSEATATDRLRITKAADLSSTLIVDAGTDIFDLFLTDRLRVKESTSDTSGWVEINPTSGGSCIITFVGASESWSIGQEESADALSMSRGAAITANNLLKSINEGSQERMALTCPAGAMSDGEMFNGSINMSSSGTDLVLKVKDSGGVVREVTLVLAA